MKKIVCEMCNSTNIVKDGGVFVCQACGMKYSLEEARSMMKEVSDSEIGSGSALVTNDKNNQQILNLLELARVSYSSKNYAETEKFCNQVIAIDATNYEAWKLKGETINFQINANNQRILEVYNCLMTSFRVLDAEGKNEHKGEIMRSLKVCFESEITFWIGQVEAQRPTDQSLKKAENTFADAYSKLSSAYDEFGIDGKAEYLASLDNLFIDCVNRTVTSAWRSTVGYNYYRQDLDNRGARWKRNEDDRSSDFRPSCEIFDTFVSEIGILINLLQYAEKQFNKTTPLQTKENVYSNLKFYWEAPLDAVGYNAMVSTTTNGYGAVTNRYEYWHPARVLTDEAKAVRRKRARACQDQLNQIEKEKKEEAIKKYWEQHAEEKAALLKEKSELRTKVETLEKELTAIPNRDKVISLNEDIRKFKTDKSALGLFKGKEKQALQDKIDKAVAELSKIEGAVKEREDKLNAEIKKAEERTAEIERELTKQR